MVFVENKCKTLVRSGTYQRIKRDLGHKGTNGWHEETTITKGKEVGIEKEET